LIFLIYYREKFKKTVDILGDMIIFILLLSDIDILVINISSVVNILGGE